MSSEFPCTQLIKDTVLLLANYTDDEEAVEVRPMWIRELILSSQFSG